MTDLGRPILSLRGVGKRYGSSEVLDVPELDLEHGDAVLFWGSNASGKSTLLRLLAGVTTPTRGRRWLDPAWRNARVALLPQSGGLYEDLSVAQNLQVLSRIYGRAPREAPFAALLGEACEAVLDRPLGTLSGGMQRIASVAVLLSLQPDLVFLDEPLSGLDAAHQDRLRAILSDLAASIPLLVMTEHSPQGLDVPCRSARVVSGRLEAWQ